MKSMSKGFTLIELVVAIGIMLILGAGVTPMILSHMKDAKVAALNETILNTKTAFDSFYIKHEAVISSATPLDETADSVDYNMDGDQTDTAVPDYLAEIVTDGFMARKPVVNGGGTVRIIDNGTAYLLAFEVSDTNDVAFHEMATTLDEKVESADGLANGDIQYSGPGDGTAGGTFTAVISAK